MSYPVLTLLAALAFAAVHALSPRLVGLDRTPRSIWLSLAGGVSTAYVFVHLLPELVEVQAEAAELLDISQIWAEAGAFAAALAGLVIFYGLERLVRTRTRRDERRSRPGVYRLHLTSFAVYNFIIAYLLPEQAQEGGPSGLATYALALGLHYVVNDRALYGLHGPRYLGSGRWWLAAATLAGWAAAQVAMLPPVFTGGIIAFLAGGVVLNVIKEELPEERESRFWAFALGAGAYAALLLSV